MTTRTIRAENPQCDKFDHDSHDWHRKGTEALRLADYYEHRRNR